MQNQNKKVTIPVARKAGLTLFGYGNPSLEPVADTYLRIAIVRFGRRTGNSIRGNVTCVVQNGQRVEYPRTPLAAITEMTGRSAGCARTFPESAEWLQCAAIPLPKRHS